MAFRTPKNIDKSYTRKLKEDILNKGLIDTSALYRSIDVTVELDFNSAGFMSKVFEFDVMIYAMDYLVYLDERFTVTYDFTNSQSFQNTTEKLRQYVRAFMMNEYPLLSWEDVVLQPRYVYLMNTPDGFEYRNLI